MTDNPNTVDNDPVVNDEETQRMIGRLARQGYVVLEFDVFMNMTRTIETMSEHSLKVYTEFLRQNGMLSTMSFDEIMHRLDKQASSIAKDAYPKEKQQ